MIPAREHGATDIAGRLVVTPTLASDCAVEVWARASLLPGANAVLVWLSAGRLRALAADLIERADLIDPPTTPKAGA